MKIQLPELAYITQHKLGPIKYVIRRAEEVEITKIDSERKGKSPLDIYTLANGEQILITATKTTVRPVGIVGVLMKVGSTTHWIYHERLEEVEELVRSKGLGALRQRVEDSWQAGFKFASEFADATGKTIRSGLRPPQLGALFAIGSHWSLSKQPATIVMPTGTGKTETMLASTVAFHRGTTLVGVPSAPLKEQTARKFYSLGLLPKLGLVTEPVLNPVVGIMNRRPKAQAELDIFEQCNVVIATMSVLAQGESVPLISEMAKRSNQLVIDEAHHIAAGTWHEFRKSFIGERILQFTATPFRRDGKVVDGKVIYNYPLGQAQRDGYFKRIAFEPVREIDEDKADEKIAVAALKQLQHDLGKGHNHLVMARCESISRAESVLKIYERLAADHHPLLVHSQDAKASRHRIQELMEGRSQIVVCVDMLGEGFDLPALKIAAIHDVHKSLGIILQFAGRFTRSSGQNLGDATIIANIADQQFSEALERLYSEDADWNQVLSELSSEAAKSHAQLMAFVQDCERLTSDDAPHHVEIGPSSLEPMLSTVVFKVAKFVPKKFVDWLKKSNQLIDAWISKRQDLLFFVTRLSEQPPWARSRTVQNTTWHLYVAYYDERSKLLFINSSDKKDLFQGLADIVSPGAELIQGDQIFRAFGDVNRLKFLNVGLKRRGRRNLRYSMYSGSDVAQALSPTTTSTSTKAMIFGIGFEHGKPVTVGCSAKGRLWTRQLGSISELRDWCRSIGAKLLDSRIKTEGILENVLIPQVVAQFPRSSPMAIEWPTELLSKPEERITITHPLAAKGASLADVSLRLGKISSARDTMIFSVEHQEYQTEYVLSLTGKYGFEIKHKSGPHLEIHIGTSIKKLLPEFLGEYPPVVYFVDGSELDGCDLVQPKRHAINIPHRNIHAQKWTGTNLTVESMYKLGSIRKNSIQYRVATDSKLDAPDILINDDDAGESADLVFLKLHQDHIELRLVHCKYSAAKLPGTRIEDVVQVASQAVRSAKWIWRFPELCAHLISRASKARRAGRMERFLVGDERKLRQLSKAQKALPVKASIWIVQPGLSKAALSSDQMYVLNGAYTFLRETVDVPLEIICSA